MDETPVRVFVHPLLKEELQIRKDLLKKKFNYEIYGGMPLISKLVAIQLKNMRTSGKSKVCISLEKRKGEKKNEIVFL